MSLIDKLKSIPKALARKSIPYLLIASSLLPTTIACSKSKKQNPNYPPSFITTTLPDATENKLYNKQIQAQDPENDPITYEITGGSASSFLEIDPNTGILYNPNNIEDSLSGQTHDLIIRVTDSNGNFTEKTFQIYVINVEDVSFEIKNITDNSALENIVVDLDSGGSQALTDSTGKATLYDIPDGEYPVVISDNTGTENNYLTFRAGKVIVNKTKASEGKLSNLELKLIPASLNSDFINEVIRYNGEIRKWETCPKFKIYTLEASTGNPVPADKITLVKDIIQNELYKFSPLFTSPVIEEIAEIPPAGFINGAIKVYWSNLISVQGVNSEEYNGNIITGAKAGCKTDQVKDVWMQELNETIIGGGESNLESSIFNDPLTVSDYTSYDLILGKIHSNRPPGNKDYGNGQAHYHDVNPSDYVINP